MTPGPAEVVQAQLDAYNAHDADAFARCYADPVELIRLDGTPTVLSRGQLADDYERLFALHPELRAEVVDRLVEGPWVVDAEHLSGLADGSTPRTVAVYRVTAGLIDQVRFLPA